VGGAGNETIIKIINGPNDNETPKLSVAFAVAGESFSLRAV